MRKITEQAIIAFNGGYKFKSGNTRVEFACMYLHENRIAYRINGSLFIDTCGWETVTTKERLNGLEGVHVYTKKGQLYLNGKEWDGKLIEVK